MPHDTKHTSSITSIYSIVAKFATTAKISYQLARVITRAIG